MTQPRSILRSNTHSASNTTKRVTWADLSLRPRAPPSTLPPLRRTRVAAARARAPSRPPRAHVCRKHRRAEGVVKKRSKLDVRRPEKQRKKRAKKRSKKCKRGLAYARRYVAGKCDMREEVLRVVDAKSLYKIYGAVRRSLGKSVDDALRRRMVDEWKAEVRDRRLLKRRRRLLETFVNKMVPGVRAQAFSSGQLSRAALAAVMIRLDRVQRDRLG